MFSSNLLFFCFLLLLLHSSESRGRGRGRGWGRGKRLPFMPPRDKDVFRQESQLSTRIGGIWKPLGDVTMEKEEPKVEEEPDLEALREEFENLLSGGAGFSANRDDGEVLNLSAQFGPLATFDVLLPNDLSLAGLPIFTQAVHLGAVQPFALSNAIDLVLGT